jgi:hypothetical protein
MSSISSISKRGSADFKSAGPSFLREWDQPPGAAAWSGLVRKPGPLSSERGRESSLKYGGFRVDEPPSE